MILCISCKYYEECLKVSKKIKIPLNYTKCDDYKAWIKSDEKRCE